MSLYSRLRNTFGAKQRDSEMQDEFAFHLEAEIQKNIASGMTADEARRQAMIAFGGVQQTREAVREVRLGGWLHSWAQDVRFGLRVLRKSPGFTLVAVLTLGLGIGANSAMFTTVVRVLYPDWGVKKPGQIVNIREATATNRGYLFSIPDYHDYQRQQKTFQQLSLWIDQSINFTGGERPARLIGGFVSANFFRMLRVQPLLGRIFFPGEDRPGAPYVAVLGYSAWQNYFGGDTKILGRKIVLNNETYTIVGVLPKQLQKPLATDVYITVQHHPSYGMDRQVKSLLLLGRLKDGVTRHRAVADLNTIAASLAHDFPEADSGIHIEMDSLRKMFRGDLRTPLFALMGAVALVLLIVCSNLANLLLARGLAREKEIAVRSALGAARIRLLRQFLCESLLVGVMGGGAGILLAFWLLTIITKFSPVELNLGGSALLDVRVLIFTAAISVGTGILFGTAPALQFSKVELAPGLTSASRIAGARNHGRLRSAFVVCQLAMTVVLLAVCSLLLKSFYRLMNSGVGLAPDHLLAMEYRLPPNKYATPQSRANFHVEVQQRIRRIPGVIAAAYVQALPFSGNWGEVRFIFPGQANQPKGGFTALNNVISPDYFLTAQIPLLRGRSFTDHDDAHSANVVMVSHAFARQFVSARELLGQQIEFTDTSLATDGQSPKLTRAVIVGIVGDTKQLSRRETPRPEIYFPVAQVPSIFGTLMVRTAPDPMSLRDAVKQAVWSVDSEQPMWNVTTVASLLHVDAAQDRFEVLLMSAFGGLALLLSALGTYGMLSNLVQQRVRELGIRIALGARPSDVLTMVLWHGLRLAAVGGCAGLAGSFAAARLIRTLLYGVASSDAASFAAALLGLVAVAAIASYIPARRATKVDPLVALRYE